MGSKPSKSGRGADNSAATAATGSNTTTTKLRDKWATLPTTGIRGRSRGRDGGEEGEDVREQQHTSLTLERSFSGGERSEGGETMSLRRRPTLGKRLRASCRNWAVARGLAKAANQEKVNIHYF